MGFLSNLFGGKKNEEFSPSSDLMPDDQFWNIIHSSYKKANGDFEAQQEVLESELQKISPKDILLFDNKFRKLRGEAYTWELWGAVYIIHGGCSDDSFMDFRDWLIAQGKEFYTRTLSNPETLVEVDSKQIDVDWEGMGYIPTTVFKKITGNEMLAGYSENIEITGEDWDENNDDLKNRFPLLWEKYS
jgi:hypothetical protein